jgi:hypothetical protein
MLIGTSSDPPTAQEAEAFFATWTAALPGRLTWFRSRVRDSGLAVGSGPESLVPLLAFVVRNIGAQDEGVDPPAWFREVHSAAGWSPVGAGLVDGLTAHVADLYRSRVGEQRASWVLETDVRSANYLQPVFSDRLLVPPWLQVRGCVVEVQRGGEPTCLRIAVEHSLASGTDGALEEPLVEVTSIGRRRWQVSFPDDVDERLGARYADLEDVLRAVEGVTEAIMEDRDRAVVSTGHGMDRAELQHRLAQVIEALAST